MNLMRSLCRTCWGWRYYLVGLGIWTAIEVYLLLTRDRAAFIDRSRTIGTWGMAAVVVYKAIVAGVMIATVPKTTLDRRWIWHMIALGVLIAYGWTLNAHPEWHGLPSVPRESFTTNISDRTYVSAMLWFQIWGYVQWSAFAVLASTWEERGRFIWSGMTRRLREVEV